jgi:uncharacterized protein YprB with RNaseH-like and TPR domain
MPFSRETRRKLAALRRRAEDSLRSAEAEKRPARHEHPASAGLAPSRAAGAPDAPEERILPELTRERLKARIRAREATTERCETAGPTGASDRSGKAEEGPERSASLPELDGPPVPVETLFPGKVGTAPLGECWVMEPAVTSVCDWAAGITRTLRESVPPASQGRGKLASAAGEAAELAFLDIETAGLSAMPVFLVGFLQFCAGELRLVQFLARDLPEEAALLHETACVLDRCATVFTYNGATFDLPYLSDRAIYHGVDFRLAAEHIDLLPLARRRYRGTFPNCKLQTLESCLCGRERVDDIPGEQIPPRYQEFVRTRDGRLLETIIRHNQFDLLTLAELVPYCLQEQAD